MVGRLVSLMVVAASMSIAGCSDSGSDSSEIQSLRFFGLAYHNYDDVYRKPAGSWADLFELHTAPGMEEDLAQLKVASQLGYIVRWNQSLDGLDRSDEILAYPADASENGGAVVFLDGSVRIISAADFRANRQGGTPESSH